MKSALDVDAPFAAVRFLVTASKHVLYLGPSGQHEAAKSPGQIVMTIDVPLQEIRSDLSRSIKKLRARHGVGRVVRERGVLGGQQRVAGTRVSTAAIGRLLAGGWTDSRILEEFPELRSPDIEAARRVLKIG